MSTSHEHNDILDDIHPQTVKGWSDSRQVQWSQAKDLQEIRQQMEQLLKNVGIIAESMAQPSQEAVQESVEKLNVGHLGDPTEEEEDPFPSALYEADKDLIYWWSGREDLYFIDRTNKLIRYGKLVSQGASLETLSHGSAVQVLVSQVRQEVLGQVEDADDSEEEHESQKMPEWVAESIRKAIRDMLGADVGSAKIHIIDMTD